VTTEETRELDTCVLCGQPAKKAVAVTHGGSGEDGTACRACLRRSRATADTWPK
jgi:hypothetical protein